MHEVVAGCFRGRVGAGRGVRCGFGKQIVRTVQVAINFIGGNMVETERRQFFRRHLLPIGAGGLEQVECANDVGLDKLACGIYRAVNITFRRQVHHGIRLVVRKHAVKFGTIANIHLLKRVTRAVGYVGQRLEIARVS